MFEFAVIDSLGAEPALLYCSLGFKHRYLNVSNELKACVFFFFFFFLVFFFFLFFLFLFSCFMALSFSCKNA